MRELLGIAAKEATVSTWCEDMVQRVQVGARVFIVARWTDDGTTEPDQWREAMLVAAAFASGFACGAANVGAVVAQAISEGLVGHGRFGE